MGEEESLKEAFPSMVIKVNTMNKTMERLLNEKLNGLGSETQSKIDNLFRGQQLTFSDYEKTDDITRKDVKDVTKWVKVEDKSQEFAFKVISESDPEEKNTVKNQVTILKEFQNWQNIIKFHGLTYDENKW